MQQEAESRITEYPYGTNSRTAATGQGGTALAAADPADVRRHIDRRDGTGGTGGARALAA
jgi:hypothetical protein